MKKTLALTALILMSSTSFAETVLKKENAEQVFSVLSPFAGPMGASGEAVELSGLDCSWDYVAGPDEVSCSAKIVNQNAEALELKGEDADRMVRNLVDLISPDNQKGQGSLQLNKLYCEHAGMDVFCSGE